MSQEINIFVSYCHTNEEDTKFLDDLLMFIKPAINNLSNATLWVDKKIKTGQDLRHTIEAALTEMNLMICMVSPEYLNSDYCINKELQDALEKRKIGTANIFPIILRKCPWKHTFFGQVLCQPKDGKPLKDWDDRDEVFSDITDELMDVIQHIRSNAMDEKKK